ncbi:unnamed protein product [Cercopithifilaria johnstoni]|uniref:Uncharacterized protein n=1 Tax=Cercopithifilaria johnstoni TaxID=2874296 RepID=A0A8J2M8X2_9BILA|nr:unnamed protein product [Cercopithifilaria johnstoni]
MGKKGKRMSRKGKQRKFYAKQQDWPTFGHSSESEMSSNEDASAYSARNINCAACLNLGQSSILSKVRKSVLKISVSFSLSRCFLFPCDKPNVTEIMDMLRTSRPTMETIQRSFQLFNVLVDNYDPPVNEILREGLDVILVEGMQFKNVLIQYYATHALLVLVKYMTEEQLKILIPRGLKEGIKAVLDRDVFLVVQEGIEACSQIAIKSSNLRDDVANWGSLRVSELLARHHSEISLEFTNSVTSFLQDLCYHKPIPEFVLECLASSARFLLQHEDGKTRAAVLNIVIEVTRNKDFVITFEHSYVRNILQFLDSVIEIEAASAFFIVGYFVKQHSSNTSAVLQMGLIKKIVPFLARHSAPEIGFEACSILRNLLSKKKYIKYVGSMVDSGLVLLLLKLLDDGTPIYKDVACITLRSLNEMWKPRYAIKLADAKHIRIMCNILKSSNTEHVACVVVLIHSALKACYALKAYCELKQAKDLIKELEAYECIAEFVDSTREDISLNYLANELYALYLNDVKVDFDEENNAKIEEA